MYTDGLRGYAPHSQHGSNHKTVIHETHYVDPITGGHTQAVERAGVEARAWWHRNRGNRTHTMSWFMLHGDTWYSISLFDQFLQKVKKLHNLTEECIFHVPSERSMFLQNQTALASWTEPRLQ